MPSRALDCRWHSDALLEVPKIGSFENRSACDRVLGCAYTPIPHLQLYRSAQHLHTSETVEPHRVPHGPRPALPLSPSRPSQLFLRHAVFLLGIHEQPFRSENGSWYNTSPF